MMKIAVLGAGAQRYAEDCEFQAVYGNFIEVVERERPEAEKRAMRDGSGRGYAGRTVSKLGYFLKCYAVSMDRDRSLLRDSFRERAAALA